MSDWPIREGTVPFGAWQTWYRVIGTLGTGVPLVLLHGGPGAAHDYLERYGELARADRPVVFYDQLGCGRSTHLRNQPSGFWTVELFLSELDNLIARLGLGPRYDILGQSWGGMLAAEHAVRRPQGLRKLVIANSPASLATWVSEANRLRAQLPPDIEAVLKRHEAAGTTSDPEYNAAVQAFYERHVCRVVPFPEEVQRTFAAIEADPTVYHTMNGPSEFHVIGSLKDWTIADRLARINVPTLVLSGEFDEATEACVRPFVQCIPDVRAAVLAGCSHMPHVEAPAACMKLVGDFLDA